MPSSFEELLASKNLRTTKPRRIVFAALKEAAEPLPTSEIIRRCPGVDRVSVYRTIDLFLELHIIERVAYGWKQRYELATPFRPHHHHLTCSQCGNVAELQSEELEILIRRIAKTRGFVLQRHTFELIGICRTCGSVKDGEPRGALET